MYWDRPTYFPKSNTGGGEIQLPPKNQLVANRQQNSAGVWNGNQVSLQTSPLTNPTAEWRSPVFDLRPDLPFLSQGDQSATPVYRSRTGDWGSLWVMVDGLSQAYPAGGIIYGTAGLKVEYQENVSPIDPTLTRRVNDPINITSEFAFDPSLIASNRNQEVIFITI